MLGVGDDDQLAWVIRPLWVYGQGPRSEVATFGTERPGTAVFTNPMLSTRSRISLRSDSMPRLRDIFRNVRPISILGRIRWDGLQLPFFDTTLA